MASLLVLSFSHTGGIHTKGIPLGIKLRWTEGWGDISKVLPRLFYAAFTGSVLHRVSAHLLSYTRVLQSQYAVVYSLFLLFLWVGQALGPPSLPSC